MTVEMWLERVRLVDRRPRVIGRRAVRDAMKHRWFTAAGSPPRLREHQILHRNELERTVRLRFVDENARRSEIGVRAAAADSKRRRSADAEKVRAKEVNPDGTERRRAPCHLCRLTQVEGVRDVPLSQGHFDVAEALGRLPDHGERRLARTWRWRG